MRLRTNLLMPVFASSVFFVIVLSTAVVSTAVFICVLAFAFTDFFFYVFAFVAFAFNELSAAFAISSDCVDVAASCADQPPAAALT